MLFNEILKGLREERGLTQKNIADACKVSPTCICQLETGSRSPTGSTLLSLADFFNCSIDYLLGREDDFGNITRQTDAPFSGFCARPPFTRAAAYVYHPGPGMRDPAGTRFALGRAPRRQYDDVKCLYAFFGRISAFRSKKILIRSIKRSVFPNFPQIGKSKAR